MAYGMEHGRQNLRKWKYVLCTYCVRTVYVLCTYYVVKYYVRTNRVSWQNLRIELKAMMKLNETNPN
jgi:hypothetical protein